MHRRTKAKALEDQEKLSNSRSRELQECLRALPEAVRESNRQSRLFAVFILFIPFWASLGFGHQQAHFTALRRQVAKRTYLRVRFLWRNAHCLNRFLTVSRNPYSDFTTVLITRTWNVLHRLTRVRNLMYSAWIKIDESLPWIELKEAFQTKTEAQEAIKEKLSRVKTKIVEMPPRKNTIKASITIKH